MTSSRILKTGVAILFFALIIAYVAFKSGFFSKTSPESASDLKKDQTETLANDSSAKIDTLMSTLDSSADNQNPDDHLSSFKSTLAFKPSDVKELPNSNQPITKQQKEEQKTSKGKKDKTEFDANWHAYSSKSAPAFTSDDFYKASPNPPVLSQYQSDSLQRDEARRNWINNHPDDSHWKFLENKYPTEGSLNANYVDSLLNVNLPNQK